MAFVVVVVVVVVVVAAAVFIAFVTAAAVVVVFVFVTFSVFSIDLRIVLIRQGYLFCNPFTLHFSFKFILSLYNFYINMW